MIPKSNLVICTSEGCSRHYFYAWSHTEMGGRWCELCGGRVCFFSHAEGVSTWYSVQWITLVLNKYLLSAPMNKYLLRLPLSVLCSLVAYIPGWLEFLILLFLLSIINWYYKPCLRCAGDQTLSLVHAKRAPYRLSYIPSPKQLFQ